MRRFLKIAVLFVLAVLLLGVGAGAWLLNDEAFLKNRVAALAAAQTGRALHVDGPLEVSLGRITTIEAKSLRFANADWGQAAELLTIGRLLVRIDLPSLLSDHPRLIEVSLEDCAVELERKADGAGNWQLQGDDKRPEPPPDDSGPLPLIIEKARIERCGLRLVAPDHAETLNVRLQEASVGRGGDDRIETRVRGSLNGQPLSVDGWLAPVGVFMRGGPLRHELRLRSGPVTLDSSGTIADYRRLAGLDLQARFTGPDIGEVLSKFQLPGVSEGAFDFRIDLDTQGGMTSIDIDGDLGNLEIFVSGSIDRLRRPDNGRIELRADGPDLEALGEAFGLTGLVHEPYTVGVTATIADGVVQISEAEFRTTADLVDIAGRIALDEKPGGTELEARLDSQELGRWAELLHRDPGPAGAVTLRCRLRFDPDGRLSIDAHAQQGDARLHLQGPVGSLRGRLDARLAVDFSAPRPGPLLHWLAGRELPEIPLEVSGTLSMVPDELTFDDLRIASGPSELRLSGNLRLADRFANSRLDLVFDTPDLATLGRSLGREDLPSGPLRLDGSLRPDEKGLAFRLHEGTLGDIRLALDGRIADLAHPLGIDADFDLELPGPGPVHAVLPELGLPDRPLAARGAFRHRDDGLELKTIEITLGDIRLNGNGALSREKHFEVELEAAGPDASVLSGLARTELPARDFTLNTRLTGDPEQVEVGAFEASLGDIRLRMNGSLSRERPFDLHVEAEGADASALSMLARRNLPEQQFTIGARLTGEPGLLRVGGLKARLGESQLDGDLEWAYGDRRRLSGQLHAPRVDLTPWLAKESEQPETTAKRQFVFDDTPVLELADLGVGIDGKLVIDELRFNAARATQVEIGVLLEGRRLEIAPFSLRGAAGGLFGGSIVLDGEAGLPELTVDIRGTDMAMALGAYEGQDPATLPRGEFELVVDGRGHTHRELAASLDGRLRIAFGQGELAPASFGFLLTDFLTELIDTLNPFTQREKVTRLDCLVAGADATGGEVTVGPVVIHAERLTVVSQGVINLHDEKIKMDFETRPRTGLGITASDLVNPFVQVGGTMARPAITLDPASSVVQGGLAVVTGGLSILAKSLANRYLSSKDPCGDALEELEKRDSAAR